jgi:predicted dienelactone hydrolase
LHLEKDAGTRHLCPISDKSSLPQTTVEKRRLANRKLLFLLPYCVLILSRAANGRVAAVTQSVSSAAAPPALPSPSGPYSIGRQGYALADRSRTDPFSAGKREPRELMVYVWYPARHTGQPAGEYVPGARQLDNNPAAREAAQNEFGPRWPLIVSGSITSHAIDNAVPVLHAGKFPVILFSHGIGDTTFSYTAQIEDFVSHGYVVVAIEHTNAAGVVLFPNGHIRLYHNVPAPTPAPKDPLQAMIASARAGTETGAEDVRFVLDQLEDGAIPVVKIMDLNRVAAVGHSYGGTLTARACQLDTRIKACISEDGEVNPVGAYFDYPDHASFKQPFLFLEIDEHPTDALLARMRESRAQWEHYLAHERQQLNACTRGSYHVVLNGVGMTHASFSDGLLLSATPGTIEASTALHNLSLTEALELSFLDKVLKKEPAPLLDHNGKTSPGVEVEDIGK